MAPAIVAEGIGKKYRLGTDRVPYGRLTESLWNALRAPFGPRRPSTDATEFWALRDVSFEVPIGAAVGVIGRNGAGKSTLLRILSRITEPTTGSAVLNGRVGSLLEVGTGFHPELTGRENIYLSGAVLGMRREEIRRKFDEIVTFADVEAFLDTPVKRYSSGMQVRLGFAVAAHLEPDILVVDEVLAVGDAEFQRKCLAKMDDVSGGGRTILFVSHNMAAVESLCASGILLDRGQVVATGTAREVVDGYLRTAGRTGRVDIADRPDRHGDGRLRFVGVDSSLRVGSESEIRIHYRASRGIQTAKISVGLFTLRGEGALFLGNEMSGDDLGELPSEGTIVCTMPACGLLPGRYSMNLHCTVSGVIADWVVDAAVVDVAEGDFFGTGRLPPPGYGTVATTHRWSVHAS